MCYWTHETEWLIIRPFQPTYKNLGFPFIVLVNYVTVSRCCDIYGDDTCCVVVLLDASQFLHECIN